MDDDELARLLRDTLGENAQQAPRGDGLPDRVLAAVRESQAGRAGGTRAAWRVWALPAAAAACVLAVAAGLLLAVNLTGGSGRPASSNGPATLHSTPAPSRSAGPTTGGPSTAVPTTPAPTTPAPTTPAPTTPAPTTPAPTSTVPTKGAPGDGVPADFRVVDLSFVGAQDGWALGTGQCGTGTARCTSLLHTPDGGASWRPISIPSGPRVATSGCTAACLEHVRFANQTTGYLFGPDSLYLTRDGGQHWQQLAGGADALETLDGTVLRVWLGADRLSGATTPLVESSNIGGTTWSDVSPDAGTDPVDASSVQLTRTGSAVYLLFGQRDLAASRLFFSSDDGQTWADRGYPCGQAAAADEVPLLSAPPDGSVSVICAGSAARALPRVWTSTDAGQTFAPAGGQPVLPAPVTAFAAASATQMVATADGELYFSADGGASFRRAGTAGVGGVAPNWIGFETSTLGHATGPIGLWTTSDGGANWTARPFN